MRQLFPLALLTLCLAPGAPRAAESYDNCTGFVDSLPAVIATQGTWCLRRDLATAITGGNAITVEANNVTLDCNGFKLGGLSAGPGTLANGVQASNRLNLTVRNCNIRGFYRGVIIQQLSAGHVIERNRLEGNTFAAIAASGSHHTLRGNQVLDTGNSTSVTGTTYGIAVSGDGHAVLDNTVSGVAPATDTGVAYGIFYSSAANEGAVVGHNRVNGLGNAVSGSAFGINLVGSGRPIVHDNVLHGPGGSSSSYGISCDTAAGTARENTLAGFASAVDNCTESGNLVNPN